MSDLAARINDLKRNFVSKGTMREKDFRKDDAFKDYSFKVSLYFLPALGLQLYQFALINHPEHFSQYKRMAKMKWIAAIGATAFGIYELFDIDKKLNFYNRKFFEPTQYQKDLKLEVDLLKIRAKEGLEQGQKKEYSLKEMMNYRQLYKNTPHAAMTKVPEHLPTEFRMDDE